MPEQSLLADTVGGQAAVFQSILLFGAVVLTVTLAVVVLLYVRRRIGNGDTAVAALSLDELRRLRDRGQLTIAEYETLREQVISSIRAGITSESEPNAR